jgi:glycine/D-amino acid oxidase-like deaminating enzyme
MDGSRAANRASGPGGRPRVLVVGGGVIGCSIADALAGRVEVTLLERERLGGATTGLAAGEVTMTASYSDYPAIARYANEFFRTASGTDGFVFHDRESVEPVPPDRAGEAQRRVERLRADGCPVDFENRVDAEIRYPFFALTDYVGLVRYREAGFLDPAQLVDLLATRARGRGARVETGTTVERLLVRDGRVIGVATTAGERRADAVVVAAGWRSPSLLAGHVDLPAKPYRTQAVVVQVPALADHAGDVPMAWIPEERVYFRPMGRGRLLVGGWAEPVQDPARVSRDADPAFRRHVAELVPRLFADAAGATFVDGWAGVDLATPDTRPIIDSSPGGPDGLLVATGFHGRGIMTAPVAGAAARARLLGDPAPFPLDPFDGDRFEGSDPDFSFVSTGAGGDPGSR